MIQLTEKMILSGCINSGSYKKGIEYFQYGMVRKLEFDQDEELWKAAVKGTHYYQVQLGFDETAEVDYVECDCPAFYTYGGFCKHIVAVLYAIRDRCQAGNERQPAEPDQKSTNTRESLLATQRKKAFQAALLEQQAREKKEAERQKIISVVGNMLDLVHHQQDLVEAVNQPAKTPLLMEPNLIINENPYKRNEIMVSLSLRVGHEKLYMVKNLEEFLSAVENGRQLVFGKKFTFDPVSYTFSPDDLTLLEILGQVYEMNQVLSSGYSYTNRLIRGGEAFLPPSFLEKVLGVLRGKIFAGQIFGEVYREMAILEADMPVNFSLAKQGEDLAVTVDITGRIVPLLKDGRFFFYRGNIYRPTETQRQSFLPFYRAMSDLGTTITLPAEYQEQFFAQLYPNLKKTGRLAVDQGVEETFYQEPLETEVYLDGGAEKIMVTVKFNYGKYSINPFPLALAQENLKSLNGRILLRDGEKERQVVRFFENGGFKLKGEVYLDDEEKIFDFIHSSLPQLQKIARIYYSEKFEKMQARPAVSFKGRVGINSADLLEVGFELEGLDRSELAQVFNSLREKRKYYRLKDGSFLPLDDQGLLEMAELVEDLELRKTDLAKKVITLPKYRAVQLDGIFQDNKLKSFRKDRTFKELVQNLREPGDMDFPVPAGLDHVLRDYQKTGFRWLKTMAAYGFGGILADDMGLGKTLQAIAFICSQREQDSTPVLVVAPTSVVFNWQAEIARFAPELAVRVISGTRGERENLLADLTGIQVVVTSYALLRRDIGDYQEQKFSCLFLDEAQYIKNPNSQTAKAAKLVPAGNVLALTGTPMENTLTELWSIFDCLMPGYLYSYQKFSNKYGKAVEREGDEQAAKELARRVSPFILRRMKKDVLPELPEKIEHKLVSELTKEQKKVYLAYWERIRGEAAAEIGKQGFDKSRIKILAGLTRLRQICCHPGLFLENYKGKSGKLLQLQELVQDALDGGHRLLIFSQFTGMLQMIGGMLDKENISYFYLDGSVNARQRLEMAQTFNVGEKNIFLVSLKAGGTGLNLTGADMVIIFDLWWNPAVEDQAADRAHRIGQKRSVQVMKLVSLGTIEEKIYQLQLQKKELIDKVIKPGETMLSALSEAEIRKLLEI